MKLINIFSIIVFLTSVSYSLFGHEMSSTQQEVWRLEELRIAYISARDVQNFRAMYHQNFVGWPSRVPAPVGHSDIGGRILEAIEEERELPLIKLRREAIQIFGDVAIVHYAVSRTLNSESGEAGGGGEWMKVTHTWMRVGETWKIIGGMAAPLKKEDE
jgi:ketosteroid isomerase-like protein